MNVKGKKIWELSIKEIEYVYSTLHMNNYVYAGLKTWHQSRMPLNRRIRIKKDNIPPCLVQSAENLVQLSPYLGNADPKTARINYTIYAFDLFRNFRHLTIQEIMPALGLLAAIAYIPIVAEKNDNLSLWLHPVVREKNQITTNWFAHIEKEMDLRAFLKLPAGQENGDIDDELARINPSVVIYAFMPRAIKSILVMIENGIGHDEAAQAFMHVEENMRKHETLYCCGNSKQFLFSGDVAHPHQIRYRNTLYLYGGALLERMGRYDEAYSWYTRDILIPNLPEMIGFYLTGLKTTERLMSAYRIAASRGEKIVMLRELIILCLYKALQAASIHAEKVLQYISTHPGLDLSSIRFYLDDTKDNYLLYAGEATREVFLSALLFNSMVNNVDYKDIDYEKYLEF